MANETAIEDIVARIDRRARRVLPMLVLGLLAVIASLIVSVIQINEARKDAERQLEVAKAALKVIEDAKRARSQTDREEILSKGAEGVEQNSARARPQQVALTALNVDIFVCDGGAATNGVLATAALGLKPEGAAGTWRRRVLSVTSNAKWNYRITGNQLRYNPDEEDAADALLARMRSAGGTPPAKVLTLYPSPGTISLFLCEGVTLAPES